MTKQRLTDRFRYLWTWELLNALVVFPGFIYIIGRTLPVGFATILATVTVCCLLIVGSVFAFLKYRDLKQGTLLVRRTRGGFCVLKRAIPVLLAAVFVIGSIHTVATGARDWPLALVLYVLAVLEYINYFHIQLMYDSPREIGHLRQHKRLKRGLIARHVAGECGELSQS